MIRTLSHTELARALDCEYQWAFAYGGQLTGGDSLKPKLVHPRLSEGRAWGAGVAGWHAGSDSDRAFGLSWWAIGDSLSADAERQREFGLHDPDEHARTRAHLASMFQQYTDTVEPLNLDRLEHQLVVPIPSRTGRDTPSSPAAPATGGGSNSATTSTATPGG